MYFLLTHTESIMLITIQNRQHGNVPLRCHMVGKCGKTIKVVSIMLIITQEQRHGNGQPRNMFVIINIGKLNKVQ